VPVPVGERKPRKEPPIAVGNGPGKVSTCEEAPTVISVGRGLISRPIIGGSDMDSRYRDRWIDCSPDRIQIRGYYFPWGTKRIRYSSIRSVRRVDIGAFRGRGRIWGTANPRYWASLDPQRPNKKVGLILDVGRFVQPFITPDDPDEAEAVIREYANLGPATESSGRGPLI